MAQLSPVFHFQHFATHSWMRMRNSATTVQHHRNSTITGSSEPPQNPSVAEIQSF
jgi:hypothetical protein